MVVSLSSSSTIANYRYLVRLLIMSVFQSFRENYEYAEALGAISIVGLSLSFLGLIVMIIYNVKEM